MNVLILFFCYSTKVAYREIAKELLPLKLYPTPKEYRQVLEEYLLKHAKHYIDTISQNSWINLFTKQHSNEICCRF